MSIASQYAALKDVQIDFQYSTLRNSSIYTPKCPIYFPKRHIVREAGLVAVECNVWLAFSRVRLEMY